MKFLLVVLMMIPLSSYAEDKSMISVEGVCTKKDSSNQFDITLNVVAEEKKSADAMASAKRSYTELVSKVKALDLKKTELTTSNYSVYALEDRDSKGQMVSRKYRATVSLDVKSEDMDKLAKVLSLAEDLGLENVHGLRFSLSEDKKNSLKKDCYASAVLEAKEKAEALASGLGLKTTGVLAINEGGSSVAMPRPMMSAMKSMESDMSVEAGTSSVEVRVQVSFSLGPK